MVVETEHSPRRSACHCGSVSFPLDPPLPSLSHKHFLVPLHTSSNIARLGSKPGNTTTTPSSPLTTIAR